MTESTKPYLIRAIYEWCVDQGFTPYLAAAVDQNTRVPAGYARDGQIVLNVSADATQGLQMANDRITFQARFGGVAQSISIPTANVLAIYARENGHGMAFEVEVAGDRPPHDAELEAETEMPPDEAVLPTDESPDSAGPGGKGGHLRIIK
ncbi:MAG: ClpXP protease specificity-enhancing factor [Rhodocyclaceae bacterium]|nr:ClpXP protease specificity-enhancing factor [Rhodocyclaceae bacterium]